MIKNIELNKKITEITILSILVSNSLLMILYIIIASLNGWKIILDYNYYREGIFELIIMLGSLPIIITYLYKRLLEIKNDKQ